MATTTARRRTMHPKSYCWVIAVTLTLCGAMMMMTSCTDAIGSMDNPVNPEQPVNPADELAIRYATISVFAHEMTHGFDNKGATYDATGSKKDWWTPEDNTKFLEKQQQMINLYNELEQYPGVQANGKKTLAENIADFGGFNLAYQLWNEKLQADGLTGEALRHQQRQFFMSYADLWQSFLDEKNLQRLLETDVHSANHNRVNGIVRLMDDWYTLFGIQPGDKLYVKPEDRVKIW